MLVLIDESGDPGFKFGRGSSAHFVVAMVAFSSFDEAEKCAAAIRQLQKDCRIYPEFKFHACRAEIRDRFFKCVNPFDFSVYAPVDIQRCGLQPILKSQRQQILQFFHRPVDREARKAFTQRACRNR